MKAASVEASFEIEDGTYFVGRSGKLHTDGAPEHNITHTTEHIEYGIMHTGRQRMYV